MFVVSYINCQRGPEVVPLYRLAHQVFLWSQGKLTLEGDQLLKTGQVRVLAGRSSIDFRRVVPCVLRSFGLCFWSDRPSYSCVGGPREATSTLNDCSARKTDQLLVCFMSPKMAVRLPSYQTNNHQVDFGGSFWSRGTLTAHCL